MLCGAAALSACSTTGNQASAKLAPADPATTIDAAYPLLPETVITVPAAYAGESDPAGSIAEASAVFAPQATIVAAATSGDAVPGLPLTVGMPMNPATPGMNGTGEPVEVASAAGAAEQPALTAEPASFAGPSPSAGALAMQPAVFNPDAPADGPVASILAPAGRMGPTGVGARSPELDGLMAAYAKHYQVPEELVRRVAKRESTFNPQARNGPYMGLMQISHRTAQGMGYRGSASGLLDAETNLKYAVRYLRGAWLVARGNMSLADRLYQRGYYYDAKRAGLLDETGLGKDRRRRPSS